jgi:hypothetical protein
MYPVSTLLGERRKPSTGSCLSQNTNLPVFHVTHWKAGSTWVQGVLQRLAGERFVPLKADMSHVLKEPIRPGGVYTPVYMRREPFVAAVTAPHKRFFVMRDLRDTLVSWYFSLAVSHGTKTNSVVADFRSQLANLDKDQGLQFLIRERLQGISALQSSWLNYGELVYRYEDMIADEQRVFAEICEHCQMGVSEELRTSVVAANSFERATGRKPGQEDVGAHRRKGIRGDWQNHFSTETKALFKERFGEHLIRTGYETTLDW